TRPTDPARPPAGSCRVAERVSRPAGTCPTDPPARPTDPPARHGVAAGPCPTWRTGTRLAGTHPTTLSPRPGGAAARVSPRPTGPPLASGGRTAALTPGRREHGTRPGSRTAGPTGPDGTRPRPTTGHARVPTHPGPPRHHRRRRSRAGDPHSGRS